MSYKIKRVTVLGLFIACEVVLSRFLSINIPPVEPLIKINLAFVPVVAAALLYGPLWAGASAALADVIGALLFPVGAYFPGFTLTAFVNGVVFGLFLYNKKYRFTNALAAAAVECTLGSMVLDTLWLYVIMGQSAAAMIPARIVKALVMVAVQSLLIGLVYKLCEREVESVCETKKREVRAAARSYFREHADERAQISEQITNRLTQCEEFKNARTVFCYIGSERELDTSAIVCAVLSSGKRLCVPLCETDTVMSARYVSDVSVLKAGRRGILEPPADSPVCEPNDIDFAVVPCLSCDRKLSRVGQSGGYYDRYLKLNPATFKAALCPSALVRRTVPTSPLDVRMDAIVSEDEIIR